MPYAFWCFLFALAHALSGKLLALKQPPPQPTENASKEQPRIMSLFTVQPSALKQQLELQRKRQERRQAAIQSVQPTAGGQGLNRKI